MNKIEKIIEYGLYLLTFLLPIQTRWIIKAGSLNGGYWEYGTYSLYATDIILIVVLSLFAVVGYKKEKLEIGNWKLGIANKFQISNFKFQKYWWLIAGFVLISAISVFFAIDKILSLYKLGWLVLGVGLFWLVTGAKYDKLKLIYFMLAGIFFQAVLGIWQFLRQASFANKWLGLAMHKAGDLGTSVVETIGTDGVGERWLRAYGGLDHPNVLGGVLVIGILLVVYLIIWRNKYLQISNLACRQTGFQFPISKQNQNIQIFNFQFSIFNKIQPFSSDGKSTYRSKWFIINYLFLIIFFIALIFTFSRSAWLALIVGLVIWLSAVAIKKQLQMQKILLEIILVMGIIFYIVFGLYENLFVTRVGANGRLEIKSNQERLASYQDAWQIIKDDWLTGVGIGNYTLASRDNECNSNPGVCEKRTGYDYQPVHNTLLLVWAEVGIVGLLFYLYLITRISIFNFQFSIFKQFSISNFIILLSIIVIMLFDHWPWSLHFGVLFFWLLAGLVVRRNVNFITDQK